MARTFTLLATFKYISIVTMLNIRASEFIYLIMESLYTLTRVSPFASHPNPGNHLSILCFFVFCFSLIQHVGEIIQYVPFSDLFHLAQCLQGPSMLSQTAGFPLFYGWMIFYCAYASIHHNFFMHSFITEHFVCFYR